MSSMQRRIDPTTGEEEWYDADPNYAYGDPRAGANPTQPSEFRDMSVLVDPREPTQDLKLPPTPTTPTLERTNIFGQTADEAAATGPLGMRPRFYGSPGKGMRPQPYGGGFGGYQQPFYGGGFGGGFGGYQQPFYGGGFGGYPRSPYGGGFGGGVFSQGYGVPRGIASLLSNYPSYMPPRMPFNPYAR